MFVLFLCVFVFIVFVCIKFIFIFTIIILFLLFTAFYVCLLAVCVLVGVIGVGQSLVLFFTLRKIFVFGIVGTLTDINENQRLSHMFFFEYTSELLLTQK